jgi:GH15 family glucan-1,4-alpha-glucosidase
VKESERNGRGSRGGSSIDSHGLIGNMLTTALVSIEGTIDFMCYPRIDSPTLFAGLLDNERGGTFGIFPNSPPTRVRQMYLPDTNVLLTRFMSANSGWEIVDFMPVPRKEDDELRCNCLIRVVRALHGKACLRMHCAPRFDYGRQRHDADQLNANVVRFSRGGSSETVTLHASVTLNLEQDDAVAHFELVDNESAYFVLGAGLEAVVDRVSCDHALEDTTAFWRAWVAQSTYKGRYREVVTRSALLLKLLSSREHGAIVAAPTFGLPETQEGGRRWDYRYTWIRDAALSTYALLRLGFIGEARNFVRWIADRNRQRDSDGSLHVMYAVDGGDAPAEEEIETLHGSGAEAPRIGNSARDQCQFDVYGALLDAIYLHNKYDEAISHDDWCNLTRTVDFVAMHWEEPDHGMWEVRNGRRHLLHSRLMCWVALDRAIRLAQKRSLPAPFVTWFAVRDRIRCDIFERFWNDKVKSFVQSPGSDTLDASVLLMPLVRFIGPKDPRWLSTLDAIGRELRVDSLIYRYARSIADDGLPGEEGGFSACSFWYAEALARAGRVGEAQLIFEKMLACANHVGLFSEETSLSGESLGNFPQALTHLALISAAYQIDRSLDGTRTLWS